MAYMYLILSYIKKVAIYSKCAVTLLQQSQYHPTGMWNVMDSLPIGDFW